MASIDRRVVEMKFDNAEFQRKAAATMGILSKLGSSLSNMAKNVKGVGDFNIKTTSLDGMNAGVSALTTKFSALQVAGVAAIGTIASKAASAGANMVKSLTIAPISGGLGEYEKKLDSIQTILANTQAAGGNLKTVSAALNDLNRYSDQTIYNFGEMARNIGTFTAAGVGLETATSSIKGIANLAALSGSSSEQASTAMYQLSQAISAGRVSLMDWNSVVNAGMGGSVFQRALAQTAVAMGKLPAGAVKLEGAMKNVKIAGQSFRDSISADNGKPSWLTSDVLTTALGNFTGDMKEADLVAQGFSKSQAQAIMAQALVAKNAATIVKTGSKLMDTLKESAESGWATTWEMIIGDFEQAPKVWTALNNVIGGFITRTADARNAMLKIWADGGGRDAFLQGIVNIYKAVMAIVKPIRDAFREIFPATTGEQLIELSRRFEEFTAKLKISGDTGQRIKSTFEGLFAIVRIARDIFMGAVQAILAYTFAAGEGAGGILAFTAVIGEFIRKLYDFIQMTGLIEKFFAVFMAPLLIIRPLIGFFVDLAIAINSLLMGDFSGFASNIGLAFKNLGGSIGDIFTKIKESVGDFIDALGTIGLAFGNLGKKADFGGNTMFASLAGNFSKIFTYLSEAVAKISGFFGNFVGGIKEGLASGQNIFQAFGSAVREAINSLVASLTGAASKARQSATDLRDAFVAAAFDKIVSLVIKVTEVFDRLKSSLGFNKEFNGVASGAGAAGGALSILGSVGSMIVSVFTGLNGVFSGLMGALGPFVQSLGAFFTLLTSKLTEWIENMDMSDAISVLNTGFFIALYIAMKRFVGNISEMVGSIGETFGQLTSTLKSMQTAVRAQALMTIALAVGILVAAVFALSKIDADALKKALVALGIMFLQLSISLAIISSISAGSVAGVMAASVQLVALAIAVKILAGAVKEMAGLNWEEMKKGLIGVGAILGAMALFTKFVSIGATGVAAGAGLVLMAIGVRVLAQAVQELGAMDTGSLIKGISALIIMVTLLAGMVLIMNATKGIPAAAAGLVILSFALLALLVPLKAYASMDWGTMAKGLALIALTLTAVGLALRAFPSGMPALAAGLVLISAALVVLTGVIGILGNMDFGTLVKGLGAMAIALAAMVIAMNGATGALPGAAAILVVAGALAILAPIIAALGQLSWETIAKGIAAIAGVLAVITIAMYAIAPVIVVLTLFAAGIQSLGLAMLLAGTGFGLFAAAIGVLAVTGAAGFAVILTAIHSFLAALPLMIEQFGHAMVTFAVVTERVAPRVLKALATTFIAFLAEFDRVVPKLVASAGKMIMEIVYEIERRVPQIAAAGLRMIIALLEAVKSKIGQITNLVVDIVTIFITTLAGRMPQIVQSGVNFILSFIEGLAKALRGEKERTGEAGADLAMALVEGMISGLKSLGGKLKQACIDMGNSIIREVKAVFGIQSPSTVFASMGLNLILGLIGGITGAIPGLLNRARTAVSGAITAARGVLPDSVNVGIDFIANAVRGLLNSASRLATQAITAVRSAITAAKSMDASEIGSAIVNGIARGISRGLSIVTSAARNLAKNALDAAKNFLGIKSPSKEFEKVGEYVNEGFVAGLTGGSREKLDSAMTQMGEMLANVIKAADDEIAKSTDKLAGYIEKTKELSAARKAAQGDLDADIAKHKQLTSERAKDEAAIKSTGAEIVRDKQRIKELTAERDKDVAAVKRAQAELDKDKAQLIELTSARNQDKAAIAAKRAEIHKDTIALRELTAERNKDTAALKAAQSELAKDEARLRSLTQGRQADIEAIRAKGAEIEKDKERLRQLTVDEKANADAIAETKARIAEATSERDRATLASNILATQMQAEVNQLKALTSEHESLSTQLDEANKSLEAAVKTRDDYKKSVSDKYGDLPDITKDTTLTDYLDTLRKKVDDTNNFSAAVQKLRDMGLNDETYKDLIEKGVDALPFVNELLAGGANAVTEVNKIGSNLIAASKVMGDQASSALYQAGVNTAQGLVNGLNSQLAAVQQAMAQLAAAMTAKINAELKIKSPSQVFRDVGVYSVRGLVQGLSDASGTVGNAAGILGSKAFHAIKTSLSDLGSVVSDEIDSDVVIRPVLDLTDIQKGAQNMNSLLSSAQVSVGMAYNSASAASSGYRSNKAAAVEEAGSVMTAPVTKEFTFIQNNTSPKALSPAELYRQTKNQLSVAKGALSNS